VDWPHGAATGVGSLPGTDPVEACALVAGELPDLPHLPELPARGPGADIVGRGAAFLADLYVDLQPSGWRFVPRPSADGRRAADYLAWDLDAAEQAFDGYAGVFKVQCAGPWTLAAGIELHRGDRALADAGAVRDIAAALAEGVARHVQDVRRRLPDATVVVQLDEPSLPAVAAGHVPSASGFDVLRVPDESELRERLRTVLDATGAGVHCCAADVPLHLLGRSAFVSLDLSLVSTRQYDALGELVENGVRLFLGGGTADAIRSFWRAVGHPAELLPRSVVVTPACGLAGCSPREARAALKRARETARRLAEAPE
jgi:hypothetical protein